ncbi:MAG: hypothetical protein WBB08_03165 [Halobacteriota archaeon]
MDKYTNLKLFTSNFAPITSTKRIIPRMKWLELVYAMPYLVLRREILNSFRRTKNVFASAKKQIWNIFVQLEFPRSRYEYRTTGLHRFSRENINIQYPISKMQAKPVSSSFVNLMKSRGFYSKLPFMELAQYASHETTKMETEKELTVTNYGLPVVTQPLSTLTHKPLGVSNKNQVTYALHSTSDFIRPLFSSYYSIDKEAGQKIVPDFKSASIAQPVNLETAEVGIEQTHLNTSEIGKVPIYHTYPKIEHVTAKHTEIIKERVIEKEDKASHATPQLPSIDLNRLTDQVYQMMTRKIRIERERRGLLCR